MHGMIPIFFFREKALHKLCYLSTSFFPCTFEQKVNCEFKRKPLILNLYLDLDILIK